jgi:hypothetical protein
VVEKVYNIDKNRSREISGRLTNTNILKAMGENKFSKNK